VELTALLGGIGTGVVIGWLLPIAHRVRWPTITASALTVAVLLGVVFVLAGVSGLFGGAIGVASGAWLHAAFLEYVAARAVKPKEA
jgi:hypothetical protein